MSIKLYRRGKIWHYRGTVAGRRLRGSTKTAVKETAQRIAGAEEQKYWKGHIDGPASVLTFAQAAMMYRQAQKSDRFLRPIEDHWRDTPVKSITAGAIRASAMVLYPTAGPATRNRQVIAPTQAVINHAAEHELCQHIRVKRFSVIRKEKTPATWTWVQSFMAHANKPNLAALACFMFLTGARISQALAVTWSDIDFGKRQVRIGSAKGGDERIARMPSELIAALARIPRHDEGNSVAEPANRSIPQGTGDSWSEQGKQGVPVATIRVRRGVTGPTNSQRDELVFSFKSRGNCKTQWAGTIRRAGIKPLSYHACRHGFATGLLDKGVNPKTVALRGGWKDTRHVFETYAHDVASADVTELLIDGGEAMVRVKA